MLKEIIIGTSMLALGPFALTGCSTTPPTVNIVTKPADRVPLNVPEVDVIAQKDVKWVIITADNYEEIFYGLGKENIDVAVFGLTDEGYKNLSLNIAAIRKLIQQQRAIIIAYEQYYKEQSEALDKQEKTYKQKVKQFLNRD